MNIFQTYSDRPNFKRQYNQTFNESADALDAKSQYNNRTYPASNNDFQRGGRGGFNQGRGYRGNSSSFSGGYNQRGYRGGGYSMRGMQRFKIFVHNFS